MFFSGTPATVVPFMAAASIIIVAVIGLFLDRNA